MRFVWLTREGWYYLLVLSFIIGGAVLREVNLLVILAGMMIGPLVFSWRWTLLTLAKLSVRRRLPARITAGDPLTVEVEITNQRRRLTSWALAVTDRLERVLPVEDEPPTEVQTVVSTVRPGQTGTASYRCRITRRGRYRFGPFWLSTRFPLGLVKAAERIDVEDTLLVWPRLGHLTRKWDQWLEAERSGGQRSNPRRGPVEGDFYALREWRSGDSQRWIHWRTTARVNEIAVRQFEEQSSPETAVLLDLWTPPEPTGGMLGNVEVAVSAAGTAISDLCRRGNNKLTVVLHAAETNQWSGPASLTFAQEVLEQLAVVEPAHDDRLAELLANATASLPATTRLIVFSTRTVDIEGMLAASAAPPEARRSVALARTVWIDITSEEFGKLFRLD